MGFNFRKSIKIAPGVRVNVGKKSSSLSFGGNGLRYSISSTGKRRTTVGIPGSGLSYTTTSGASGRSYKSAAYQNRQILRQQQMQEKKELARFEAEMYQNTCEVLKAIHIEADEPVDWHYLAESPPPFQENEVGPNEQTAVQNLNNYKPRFFEKLFKNDKTENLQKAVTDAREKDKNIYDDWSKLKTLSKRVLSGDLDAYMTVIEEMDPLQDLK